MARLTKEQWNAARNKWESDPREGFDWLVAELSLDVSRQAVSKAAKAQEWTKVGATKKVAEKKVAQPKSKVAQPTKATKSNPKATEPESDETGLVEGEQHHGNSLYKHEYDEQAYKLCLLGATDVELADFFRVSKSTVNLWKLRNDSFSDSLQRGKIMADANVSEKLYHRALGYSHDEEKIFNNQGEILRAETTKHYPPDTGAIKLWLLNRRPKDWKANVETPVEINLNIFPAKEVLDGIYAKALEEAAIRDTKLIGRRERLGILIEHDSLY